MTENRDIALKVCKICDAPLPNDPKKLNYFNNNKFICDDCFIIEWEQEKIETVLDVIIYSMNYIDVKLTKVEIGYFYVEAVFKTRK